MLRSTLSGSAKSPSSLTEFLMKHNPTLPTALYAPSDDEIRGYAFHLYEQSGCVPGHDLDHWLEATACLQANIPAAQSHHRLHHHVHGAAVAAVFTPAAEALALTV